MAMCGFRQTNRVMVPLTVTVLPVSKDIPEWWAVAMPLLMSSSAIAAIRLVG
jgi:hypothetical protein